MNDKFLKIITYLTIGIISYVSASYFYKSIEENHIEVPGTVIGKEKSYIRMTYKPYVAYSIWILSVKPDNNNKYKPYTVIVNDSAYNVGQHVCFKVMSKEVDPNGHNDFFATILFMLSIVGCIYAIRGLLLIFCCNECD